MWTHVFKTAKSFAFNLNYEFSILWLVLFLTRASFFNLILVLDVFELEYLAKKKQLRTYQTNNNPRNKISRMSRHRNLRKVSIGDDGKLIGF